MIEKNNWPNVRIDDIAEKVAMGPFGSSIKVETFVKLGIPVISGQHLHGSKVNDNVEFNFISEEHADRLKNANVKRGDIIFTHAGNIGQVAFIPENSKYDRYVISQRQFFMRCDRIKVIPEYVVAYFNTPEGKHKLLANTSSVGVPSIAQPVTYLRTIEIPIPPLSEQRAIAHILGTLDDKIELNRRMNETLEAMARALYKSWFVDFDPVRAKAEGRDTGLPKHIADLFPARFVDSELGEIPEGWEVKSLDQIAQFLNGLALQKFPPTDGRSLPVIKIAQLRSGRSDGSDRASADLNPEYIIVNGDILFSWSGSLECVLWVGGSGALNQHLFKVTSSNYPRWLCYFAVHHHLDDFRHIAAGKATTMGHIQRHHLSDAKISVPAKSVLREIDQQIAPLFERLWKREEESHNLSTVREVLLPKLISGELRVPKMQRLLEAQT